MKLTIFSRLVVGYLAIFVLVMAMSLYTIFQIGQFNDVTRSVLMVDNRLIDYNGKLSDAILSQVRYERKFFITKDEALYTQFLMSKGEFDQYLQEAVTIADSPSIKASLDRAKRHYQHYQDLLNEEVKSLKTGRPYSAAWYLQEKEKATDRVMEELESMRSESQQRIYGKISDLNKSGSRSRRVVILLTTAFLVFGIAASLFINRSITQPISILKKKTGEIANGDFESNLNLSSPPEIKALASSFNFMCQKLKELDRMKSDFFSSMSHELRNPLTTLKEGIGLLLEGAGGSLTEKQKRLLSILTEETNRLIGLVNSLLDLSKIEAGMMTYHFEAGNLAPLIRKAIQEIGPLAEAKKIGLEAEITEGLPLVKMDQEKILQALRNLIGNAVKFTPQGGLVRVSSDYTNGNVKVSVSDTGSGIPEENLMTIFEKFHQGPLRRDQMNGTGLGLAIVKHIITAHGGKVWAESELNQGSTFTFLLPA
jgi:two-component system sensor histidine kinase GlrK